MGSRASKHKKIELRDAVNPLDLARTPGNTQQVHEFLDLESPGTARKEPRPKETDKLRKKTVLRIDVSKQQSIKRRTAQFRQRSVLVGTKSVLTKKQQPLIAEELANSSVPRFANVVVPNRTTTKAPEQRKLRLIRPIDNLPRATLFQPAEDHTRFRKIKPMNEVTGLARSIYSKVAGTHSSLFATNTSMSTSLPQPAKPKMGLSLFKL